MVYFYTLSSTRNLEDIRYVGKTIQSLKRRLQAHICDAKRAAKRGYKWNKDWNWINYELANGFEIKIEYLDELNVSNKDDWEWLETYWIHQLKAWGFLLNNMTDGGDGNKNQIFNSESLKKRSNKLKGRKRSQAEKDAISKGKKGVKLSEAHKNNVRKAIVELQGKAVKQYDKNGKFIKEWTYIKEAADNYNTTASNISKCCRRDKNHTTCAGYIWRHSDDKLPVLDGITVKKLLQLDLNGNIVKEWDSATQACETGLFSAAGISNCCNGKIKTYKGFIWKFNK